MPDEDTMGRLLREWWGRVSEEDRLHLKEGVENDHADARFAKILVDTRSPFMQPVVYFEGQSPSLHPVPISPIADWVARKTASKRMW